MTPIVVLDVDAPAGPGSGGGAPTYAPPLDPMAMIAPEGATWDNGYGVETMYFTDALGVETDLSTLMDVQFKDGINGRWMPSFTHFSDAVPELDGERYRGTRALPSTYSIPFTIVANDLTTLRTRCLNLVRALSPKRGLGTLTVETVDGRSRFVRCILDSRIEGDPACDGELYDAKMVLGFKAFDPFWYDLIPVEKDFNTFTSVGTFFPAPLYRIGASTVFSSFVETNEGDSEAWPVWTITGPGKDLALLNNTTGLELLLDFDIAPGQSVTIDTRPGYGSIETGMAVNLFGLTDGEMWPLIEGPNDISVTLLDTTSATNIHLSYSPGFLGV